MFRDDFACPVYHGDNKMNNHHSPHSYHPREQVFPGRFHHDQNYNRFESIGRYRSHPGPMYDSTHSWISDRRPYCGVNAVQTISDRDEARRGFDLASPLRPSSRHKRSRSESTDDPSFIPPLPADSEDRFELITTYGSKDMYGGVEHKTKRHRRTFHEREDRVAHEEVGMIQQTDRYHSYNQDSDRRLWEEHHLSNSHDYPFADSYDQHNNLPVDPEHIYPFSSTGEGLYSDSKKTDALYNRSASTDDETPDHNDDDMNSSPEAAPFTSPRSCYHTLLTTRTTGGERTGEGTKEVRLHPSPREIEFLPNPRAKEALHVWYQRLRELVAFKKEYGHTNVRQKYPPNPQLGIWVNKQRCTRQTLSKQKLDILEAIGFDWGTKKGDHAWQNKFDELLQYKKIHNDCLVPTKCSTNPSLGRWVSTQRAQYKLYRANRKTTMTAEKIEKLEAIGFAWSMVE